MTRTDDVADSAVYASDHFFWAGSLQLYVEFSSPAPAPLIQWQRTLSLSHCLNYPGWDITLQSNWPHWLNDWGLCPRCHDRFLHLLQLLLPGPGFLEHVMVIAVCIEHKQFPSGFFECWILNKWTAVSTDQYLFQILLTHSLSTEGFTVFQLNVF